MIPPPNTPQLLAVADLLDEFPCGAALQDAVKPTLVVAQYAGIRASLVRIA